MAVISVLQIEGLLGVNSGTAFDRPWFANSSLKLVIQAGSR
jgi:hypothetical protein